MRLLSLAAATLAALLLTIALASAQEPPESQTATRLEPGLNLVGWVGETASVSQLFDEIPQLESVWAWDAELDDWIVAGRNAPEWLGGLGRVTAGMGLRFVLGGEEPFLWQRPTEPTRGLAKLRTGWNLVAWSGADGAPIEQVAKGIGWSLRELRRWNAANQQWEIWTSPERSTQLIATNATDQAATDEEAEPITVRRGEALWVNTARSVNWLQPTDILPRLIFPGGASDALQARVREDMESVLAFYGRQYGIQAEPDFTVYVAKDADALIQAYKDDGEEIDDAEAARIRARWDRVAGWGGGEIMVKQTKWPEDLSTSDIARGRYLLTHEYFHILQDQLSDSWASQWLVEGTADWVEGGHQVLDGEQTLEALREREQSELSPRTPTLRSAESKNARWEYTLGWLAIDHLTEAAGGGSYIEFWRRLASTDIGPHHRWTSTPDWRTAFQETFGVPVSSFYADFDAWQRGQIAANGATASSTEGDARWIRGRVTDESGAPVVGVFVNAIRVEGKTSVGWNQRAETGVDGAFTVRAPEGGDYRISVDINDDCSFYHSNGGLTEEPDDAQPITVAKSDAQVVNIQLSSNSCRQIRGQVVDAAGEPLAGISTYACQVEGGACTQRSHTARDGSFAVSVPTAGEYRLNLNLADNCTFRYRLSGGLVLGWSEATPIQIVDSDVSDIAIRVPHGMCAWRISGRVLLASGQPLANTYVSACREVDALCSRRFGRSTDDDGSFAFTMPVDDAYRLSFELNDCAIQVGPRGFTGPFDSAYSTVRVAGQDARLGLQQIPWGICGVQIKGALARSDGQPLSDTRVRACREANGRCESWMGANTDSNGVFAIAVPHTQGGEYRLSFPLDNCTLYFRAGGFTTAFGEHSTVRVENEDVHVGLHVIPAGIIPEGCLFRQLRKIEGVIAKSDGQPLAPTNLHVCRRKVDNTCEASWSTEVGDGGSFSFNVRPEGEYSFSIPGEGCSVHFRNGSFTADKLERSAVPVNERDVSISAQIPEGICAQRISGCFVNVNNTPLAEKFIEAYHVSDYGVTVNYDGVFVHTDASGCFGMRVPADGAYQFGIYLQSGCRYTFEGRTLGSADNPVRVSGGDVTGVELRLPGTIEELCG